MDGFLGGYVTRWYDDPFSLGAYSTLLPGGSPEDRRTLGQCLGNRLVLAGEACNPHAPAMTHGAWDDGVRAAGLALAAGARQVIVIGAGCAGLAAARRLREAGVECCVLEGRERIGGRTFSQTVGGVTVDLGAAWLQQFAHNALGRLAEQQGRVTVETDFGHPLAAAHDGAPGDIEAAWLALLRNLDRRLPLAEGVARYLAGLEAEQARATRFALDSHLVQEACLPLEQLSVDALDEEGVGHGDRFLPGGYSALIASLAEGLDIRLGQPVKRIDWSGPTVRVNGLDADFCICTVPLGVLKTLDFVPALPEPQQRALAHLGMGRLEKVVLQFERRWWPVSPSGYLRWYDVPSTWGEWLDLTDQAGVPTVVGLIAADAVERIYVGRSDEAIIHDARIALQAWARAIHSIPAQRGA